jgi:hypothetical protein
VKTVSKGDPAWSRRNPPARPTDYARVDRVARALARQLAREGARAVVLSGSWARHEARRYSDLDLWRLGRAGQPTFRWHDPFLVSISRINPTAERRRFLEPPHTGELLGAWRTARILYDPRGDARRLQRYAQQFRWDRVGPRCERWVARSVASWGEEAIKLVSSLARGERDTAAVQRNLLAGSLPYVLAVHRRTVWVTDNGLSERLGRIEGPEWWDAQQRALGLRDESLAESCRGALDLYRLTVERVLPALGRHERATVAQVLSVLGPSARAPTRR